MIGCLLFIAISTLLVILFQGFGVLLILIIGALSLHVETSDGKTWTGPLYHIFNR